MTKESAVFDTIVQKHIELPYLEFLPADYDDHPERNWPLAIFLHGAGERGTDLESVTKHGLAKRATEGEEFPFIIVAPQCPETTWWHLMMDELCAALHDAVDRYRVDTSRIYLTGMSMGGYGTWHLAVQCPHAFAAIAPICGGGDRRMGFPKQVRSISNLPVWAFHGDDDDVVPPEMSRELVKELREAGNENVKLTIYEGVGHDSWTRTYDDPALYEWLLSQRNDAFSLTR